MFVFFFFFLRAVRDFRKQCNFRSSSSKHYSEIHYEIKEEILQRNKSNKNMLLSDERKSEEKKNIHLREYIYTHIQTFFLGPVFTSCFTKVIYTENSASPASPHSKVFWVFFLAVWLTKQINSGTQWLEGLIREQ